MGDSMWRAVRCASPLCSDPRGRVLFTERNGLVCTIKRGGFGTLSNGPMYVAICRCGAVWRNPDPNLTEAVQRSLLVLLTHDDGECKESKAG